MITLGYLTDSAAASILAASGNLSRGPAGNRGAAGICSDVLVHRCSDFQNRYAFPGSLDTLASHGYYAYSRCFCWLLPGLQECSPFHQAETSLQCPEV